MFKRVYKLLVFKIPLAFLIFSISWVMLYKFVAVRWTPLMLKRSVEYIEQKGYRNHRTWVDIEEVAPVMIRAVIASEDGRFMEHRTKGKKIRGCSTISQQVAKNCFTFCGRSWWRKG